jgi:PDDEXK-like domain of unknown function (DUF3799)
MQDIQWEGEVITKPGMYKGIPLSAYHDQICDGFSVSSSGLRTLVRQSPAHFYDQWSGNPNRTQRKDERHFLFGSAAHHLFLGQKGFGSLYKVEPTQYEADDGTMKPWNNNANACKDWHKTARQQKLSVLKAAEAEQLIGMAKMFHRHPMLNPTDKKMGGLLHGLVERSIIWRDEKTGIWIKTRPDVAPVSSVDFADYKTITSVEYDDVRRSVGEFGYHMQGDLILTGARKVLKMDNPRFTLVFQEKKSPYCVRIFTPKDEELERGARLNRKALDTMAGCLKSKIWPGPGGYREDAEYIEIPEWEQKREDYFLERGL